MHLAHSAGIGPSDHHLVIPTLKSLALALFSHTPYLKTATKPCLWEGLLLSFSVTYSLGASPAAVLLLRCFCIFLCLEWLPGTSRWGMAWPYREGTGVWRALGSSPSAPRYPGCSCLRAFTCLVCKSDPHGAPGKLDHLEQVIYRLQSSVPLSRRGANPL